MREAQRRRRTLAERGKERGFSRRRREERPFMLPQLCHLDARCLREPRRPLGGQPRPKYANCMRDPLLTLVLAAIAAGCGPSDKGAPQAPPPTAAAPATPTPSGAAGSPPTAPPAPRRPLPPHP